MRARGPVRAHEGACAHFDGREHTTYLTGEQGVRRFRVYVDDIEKQWGDARGRLGHVRIAMPDNTVGRRVKVELEGFYVSLQYVGVEGTPYTRRRSLQEEVAPASDCGEPSLPCSVVCSVPPEAAAEASSAAAGDFDRWLGVFEACGCELSPAPEPELIGALPPAVLEAAVVDELCATRLKPWLEWTEDAGRAEISATTITLFEVTDHVHYTPMCHKLCGANCGTVPLLGASSSRAADVGLGNCFTVAPLQFFTWLHDLLSDGSELSVNLAGFDADGAALSVAVLVSRPEYNDTSSSLALAYRMQDGEVEDPGRRKLLQTVVERDLLVVSRAHLTGTMGTTSEVNLALPSDLTEASGVAAVSRSSIVSGALLASRSSIGIAGRNTGTTAAMDATAASSAERAGGWTQPAGAWNADDGTGEPVVRDLGFPLGSSVGSQRPGRVLLKFYCMWAAVVVYGPKVLATKDHLQVGSWYVCAPRSRPSMPDVRVAREVQRTDPLLRSNAATQGTRSAGLQRSVPRQLGGALQRARGRRQRRRLHRGEREEERAHVAGRSRSQPAQDDQTHGRQDELRDGRGDAGSDDLRERI